MLMIGWAKRWLGDSRGAREAFAKSRETLRKAPSSRRSAELESRALGTLGMSSAGLGDLDGAIRIAGELASMESDDMWSGPTAKRWAAQVYANAGDADRAIDLLEELSEIVYQFAGQRSWFRLEARWDPLREDPRFQALIED